MLRLRDEITKAIEDISEQNNIPVTDYKICRVVHKQGFYFMIAVGSNLYRRYVRGKK